MQSTVSNLTSGSSSTFQISPLECLNYGNKIPVPDKKFALIVTDVDADSGCKTFYSYIKSLWDTASYRAFTPSSEKYITKCLNQETLIKPPQLQILSLKQSMTDNKDWKCSTVKTDQCEIANCLEFLCDEVQTVSSDIASIVIVSNGTIPLHKVVNYMQAMCCFQEKTNLCSLSAIFGHSCICILCKGETTLDVSSGHEGECCGIIPFGEPVKVTTTGLHWNLNGDMLGYGNMISTSNKLDGSGKVTIFSEKNVVWTMDILCNHD